MFSEKLGITLLFSILVWLGATLLFVFFGNMRGSVSCICDLP
ncbi:MAG: hypothetical protein K0R47_345 [Brevibacillus sp.]|nr:hypothetical protein [Brevibacillus sp.]